MNDDIVLKIKENEAFEVLKLIAFLYLIFLFFLALLLRYQESVIQSFIILAFVVIIDALNSGEMVVTEKGISTRETHFVKYSKIYRLELKNRILYVYTRDRTRPYKITFALSEDSKVIQNTYRYIDSKVKGIAQENQDHKEYVEKYL